VKYWLHNNMVTVDGTKMGKSLNNFITLKEAFVGRHERLTRAYDPLAVRQLILNSHYRSPLDFSDAALYAALSGYTRITEAVLAIRKAMASAPEGDVDDAVQTQLTAFKGRFEEAMNDDLNTSVALSVLFDQARLTNTLLSETKATQATLNAINDQFTVLGGDVLGIVKSSYVQGSGGADDEIMDKLVTLLMEQRQNARKAKDFAASDMIRDRLAEAGVELKDTPNGTEWSLK